jgi:hypothetical protein
LPWAELDGGAMAAATAASSTFVCRLVFMVLELHRKREEETTYKQRRRFRVLCLGF